MARILSAELFKFSCPKVDPTFAAQHPRYADPEDCRYYYVCINGETPRKSGCKAGQAFNPKTISCDKSENVPQWYGIIFLIHPSRTSSYLVIHLYQTWSQGKQSNKCWKKDLWSPPITMSLSFTQHYIPVCNMRILISPDMNFFPINSW